MIKLGMLIGERYEILDKIGTGGMSDVYKAKDQKLNRFVAVKVLKQEFSENKNFVSKFRVEAQAAAGLMHPNIVNVYDVGEEEGIHYIVMELVEGITLKKYIEKTFSALDEKLAEIEEAIHLESEDALTLTNQLTMWWENKRKVMELFTFSPDLRAFSVALGEQKGSLECGDYNNALSKCVSLFEMSKNLHNVLDFNIEDII